MSLANFPANPLPIRSEIQVGGTWTDVTSRVRLADQITIEGRGRSSDQGRPNPVTCNFTLNNRDGLFSNRNPLSPYYGLLPRNTPVRHSVTEDRSWGAFDTSPASQIRTVDKASLDIVGDIDIRAEIEPEKWTGGGAGRIIAAKWRTTASNNRSWAFAFDINGYLSLYRSTNGTAVNFINSTVPLPRVGPIAVRVTLDVDTGAGQYCHTFYTSDSISGTWTQLGAQLFSTGTTSIFNSNADVQLGRFDDTSSGGLFGSISILTGRVYAFELRNGINGTLVANADLYNRARGTTSFSDGLTSPNTWLVEGTAEVTPDNRRFTGEISSLPVSWDTSGKDVWVNVQAADVTRRLSVGATPIQSALRRYMNGYITQGNPVSGYWPCEDGTQATTLSNVTSGQNGILTDVSFGQPSDFPASAGSVTLNSAISRMTVRAFSTATTGAACFNFAFKVPSLPGSPATLFDVYSTGTSTWARTNLQFTATGYNVTVVDSTGATVGSSSVLYGASSPVGWTMGRLQIQQVSGNVQVDWGWYPALSGTLFGAGATVFAGTAGRIDRATFTGSSLNAGTQYAHLFIGQFFLNNISQAYTMAANAFSGETTTARYLRICGENGINGRVVGNSTSAEQMGPQPISTPLEVLSECSDIENGGPIYPDRNSNYLIFRTRRSVINQYGPTIDYSLAEIGPTLPTVVDDDQALRNSVTAQRADGSSGSYSKTSGVNSTQSPPAGVGTVSTTVNRNAFDDNRLQSLAEFEVELGTWDEPRWPAIAVSLERQNYTIAAARVLKGHNLARIDVGDLFHIANLPTYAGVSSTIDLYTQGIREVLGNRTWQFYWNTSPYGPFYVNNLIHASDSYDRAAGSNSVTATTINTTALSFTVTTASGALWGTTALRPGNFPQNVVIAGEVITISGITGTGTTQTFTATARSVNGIVKSHVAGEAVQVQYPMHTAL